ncbi:hypothetical protein MBLNU459_g4902t1 [Dothideomycetes sp. NU459]
MAIHMAAAVMWHSCSDSGRSAAAAATTRHKRVSVIQPELLSGPSSSHRVPLAASSVYTLSRSTFLRTIHRLSSHPSTNLTSSRRLRRHARNSITRRSKPSINRAAASAMADYAKMKNAELEALLKERNLPHTGKKADLVKRLQDDDTEKASAPAPAAAPKAADDEIDWDDEPATNEASKPTSEPAAAALAAGGQGQVDNPQAVPNQVADVDPSTTNDLTVSQPADAPAATTGAAPETAAATEEPAKPAVDFSSGLAKTTLDQEIEKRKARAKKFGLDESADETLKALERQKKFGGTDLPGRLNEALPEKREKKRGRDAAEETGGRKKRERPAVAPRNDSGRRNEPRAAAPRKANGGPTQWMSEADKAKAEARKAKFGTA